jgi:hypothetical protein
VGGTVNGGPQGQVVEHLDAAFPGVDVAILAVDLVIEAVDGGDLPEWVGGVPRFVVAAESRDAVTVFDFEAEEQREGFD